MEKTNAKISEGVLSMIKSKKGLLLDFISEKVRTTKDIRIKFGDSGSTWTSLAQLEYDGLIKRPKKGIWESTKKHK